MRPLEHEIDRPVAVIDVGSSAIRLAIAELSGDGSVRMLESASKPVSLGQDVFMDGRISTTTVKETVQIINGFRELMQAYDVGMLRAVGTSALREAQNQETFLDRIFVRTGVQIRVIDGIEENHFAYVAIREALRGTPLDFSERNALIMEVGAGSTDVMVFHQGQMASAHTLTIGSHRTRSEIRDSNPTGTQLRRYIDERVSSALEHFRSETKLDSVDEFIAAGGDMRIAGERIGERTEACYVIDQGAFRSLIDRLATLSSDEITDLFHIPYAEAENIVFALSVNDAFLSATAAERIIVPFVSIRDGILLTIARANIQGEEAEYYRQVVSSAMSLARKYQADESHALHVTELALRIYDHMKTEHGLGPRHRVLLQVASILHDIGTFINFGSHHKHGQYIVDASEIFGLHKEETALVSNVVRYHRRAAPSTAHPFYASLPPADRVTVCKLAAILRVADALDRSHTQRIRSFELKMTDTELIIDTQGSTDTSHELFGIETKALLFEDVFGLRVVLV
jgi:exopolyphosphatase/guanosine-5'-triphosphate,3'-diphosphate pyrophosphatase